MLKHRLVLIAAGLMLATGGVVACGEAQHGGLQSQQQMDPVAVATRGFVLARANDWPGFSELAISRDRLLALAAASGEPLPPGLWEMHARDLASGFARIRQNAAGPMRIVGVRPEGVPAIQAFEVKLGYLTRQGAEQTIKVKLVRSEGRLYVTALD